MHVTRELRASKFIDLLNFAEIVSMTEPNVSLWWNRDFLSSWTFMEILWKQFFFWWFKFGKLMIAISWKLLLKQFRGTNGKPEISANFLIWWKRLFPVIHMAWNCFTRNCFWKFFFGRFFLEIFRWKSRFAIVLVSPGDFPLRNSRCSTWKSCKSQTFHNLLSVFLMHSCLA